MRCVSGTGQAAGRLLGLGAKELAPELLHVSGRRLLRDKLPGVDVGGILIDNDGNFGSSHTAPKMAHGWIDQRGEIHTTVRSDS